MGRAAGERRWPGATAMVLLLSNGRLYTANAGDCRAVLCSQVRLGPLHAMRLSAALTCRRARGAVQPCQAGPLHAMRL